MNSPSLFGEEWWLDIVTSASWKPLRSRNHSGAVAGIPLYVESHYGCEAACNPPLTRTLSLSDLTREQYRGLGLRARHGLIGDLVDQLPREIPVLLTFDPDTQELYPFAAKGFSIGVEYTFRLGKETKEALWLGLRSNTRNKIKNSQRIYKVSHIGDPKSFESIYTQNLYARGKRLHWKEGIITDLATSALERNCGAILVCTDEADRPAAAVFLVHDREWCYLLLQTLDRTVADKGVMALLVWEAISWAEERGLPFDFDTSDFFARQFGAVPVGRLTAHRMRPLSKAFSFHVARKIARLRGVR